METFSIPSEYRFKVILIGDSTVGKTGLYTRYLFDEYRDGARTTLGVEFNVRDIQIQDKSIHLEVWDTAGQERYRGVSKLFYKNAVGLVVVYDITNRDSFTNLNRWISDAQQLVEPHACMLLVGNKSDLEIQREVSMEEGLRKAQELGCKFVETSAKDSINIVSAFHDLASDIFEKAKNLEKEGVLPPNLGGVPKDGIEFLRPKNLYGDTEKKYASCC